jgi:hypothetical protein
VSARVVAVAGAIAAILYVMLDSGVVRPEAGPRVLSAGLIVLAILFAVGSWTASMGGQKNRSSMLAGLSAGVGGYAILRLVAF